MDSREEGEEVAARRQCDGHEADGSERESGGLRAGGYGEEEEEEEDKGRRRLEKGVLEGLDARREVERRSLERGREVFRRRGVVVARGNGNDDDGWEDGRREMEECIKRHAERCVREEKVVLRAGWEGMFDGILSELSSPSSPGKVRNIDRIGIISVGWSPVWIKACIAAAWARSSKREGSVEGRSDMEEIYDLVDKRVDVCCNNVLDGTEAPAVVDGQRPSGSASISGLSSSAIGSKPAKASSTDTPLSKTVAGIFTASDKLDALRVMLRSWSLASPAHFDGANKRVLCFGDSPTDIGCLLADGVTGICMRDSDPPGCLSSGQQGSNRTAAATADSTETDQDTLFALLRKVIGVKFRHVQTAEPASTSVLDLANSEDDCESVARPLEGYAEDQEQSMAPRIVYWARDFQEVLESGILDAE